MDAITLALIKALGGNGGGGGSSGGGVLVVGVTTANAKDTPRTAVMDKTWQEIHDAPLAVVHFDGYAGGNDVAVFTIISTDHPDAKERKEQQKSEAKAILNYSVTVSMWQDSGESLQFFSSEFIASSANDYPSMSM